METDISSYDAIVMLSLLIIWILFNIVESVLLFLALIFIIFLLTEQIFALVTLILDHIYNDVFGKNYVFQRLLKCGMYVSMAQPMNTFFWGFRNFLFHTKY